MKFKQIKPIQADLLLLSVAIFWGVTFLMTQDAIKDVPVYSFLFYRFGLAALVMLIISYPRLKKINSASLIYGVSLGIILFSAYALQTFGLVYSLSSVVAFITGFSVIIVPFISYMLFKDKLSIKIIISSALALVGLYFLTLSGELPFGRGEFLTLMCAVAFAMHIILTGKFASKGDVFLIVLFQLITVTILSLIFSLSLESVTFNVNFSYTFVQAVIITAVFATVYAFLIQTYMQQFTSATKTAIIFTLEPVSAALTGAFVGGEILTTFQIIGGMIIVLATLLSEIKFNKKVKSGQCK